MRRGDERVPLDTAKLKQLLALLLLHPREARPTAMLVEELWEGDPPESAAKLLQVYVSQLRKQLHAHGEQVLVTRGGGYAVDVDSDSIDVARFERLVREGVAARKTDARAAAETLATALGLWRGPPLSEFRYLAFAQAEVARLEELRLVALEERIEADLVLGEHAQLVGELEQLVAREPHRERLHALLMLALYRAGRQADAVEAYHRFRRALVDELGIEPGRELRELVAAILRQDDALGLVPLQPRPRALTPREIDALVDADRTDVAFLHWQDDRGERRILRLARSGPVTLGRTSDADVVLAWDREVSRTHAVLQSVAGQWTLEDADSRNGTFVNGSRVVGRRRLHDRDRLCFGNTVVSFREPVDADDPESTARARDAREAVPLTDTQRRILIALCRPLSKGSSATPASNREISDEIFLSVDAVKAHLRLLFDRFGVGKLPQNEKRAQLARRALGDGVVVPHDF